MSQRDDQEARKRHACLGPCPDRDYRTTGYVQRLINLAIRAGRDLVQRPVKNRVNDAIFLSAPPPVARGIAAATGQKLRRTQRERRTQKSAVRRQRCRSGSGRIAGARAPGGTGQKRTARSSGAATATMAGAVVLVVVPVTAANHAHVHETVRNNEQRNRCSARVPELTIKGRWEGDVRASARVRPQGHLLRLSETQPGCISLQKASSRPFRTPLTRPNPSVRPYPATKSKHSRRSAT